MSFSVCLGNLGSVGSCVYRRNDLTLEYLAGAGGETADTSDSDAGRGKCVSQQRNAYFIAGTLTLVFSGRSRALLGLDAYTNSELWTKRERLSLPESDGIGELRLTDLPDDEDRLSIDSEPRFEYCEESRVLRISLGTVDALAYYTVCKDIIVGIGSQQLAELYLLNVTEMT